MVKHKRLPLGVEAARQNQVQVARLGEAVRAARHRRCWTQGQLGGHVGLARQTVSAIERGRGASHTLDTWQRLAVALGITLRVELARDPLEAPVDAGHLAVQELVLRVARRAGYATSFELPTRPADPARSVDAVLRDDRRGLLILVECWNTMGDVGAAARSTNRKLADVEALAVARWDSRPWLVRGAWVVRDTRRNRRLVGDYPAVFASRFPGSSRRWLRALTEPAVEPPLEPGLVWCDVAATRLFAWRRG